MFWLAGSLHESTKIHKGMRQNVRILCIVFSQYKEASHFPWLLRIVTWFGLLLSPDPLVCMCMRIGGLNDIEKFNFNPHQLH